jgi:hypothetical protein
MASTLVEPLPVFTPTASWIAELAHIERRRDHQIDHHRAKLRQIDLTELYKRRRRREQRRQERRRENREHGRRSRRRHEARPSKQQRRDQGRQGQRKRYGGGRHCASHRMLKSHTTPALKYQRRKHTRNQPLIPLLRQTTAATTTTTMVPESTGRELLFCPEVTHYKTSAVSLTINLHMPPGAPPLPAITSEREMKRAKRIQAKKHRVEKELAEKQHLWELHLYKHRLPQRRVQSIRTQSMQKAWHKAMLAVAFAVKTNAVIVAHRRQTMARRQSISAANLLGNSWKKSYSDRKAVQHRRSIEILREKAWVARLKVRSRMRKKESIMIRKFVIEAAKVGRFAYVCRAFKYKIISLQRRVRSFLVVHKVRLEHMFRFFRKYEGAVLNRLNRERREKRRLEEASMAADLTARAAAARNADQLNARRHGNKPSKTEIGRSIAKIQEIGRQLDSVAFRMSESERKAKSKMAKRRKASPTRAKDHDEIRRASRPAVLSVLSAYLREKRREHFIRLKRHKEYKHERLEALGEISMQDARRILQKDLSMKALEAEKRETAETLSRIELPPVVLAFTSFRHDLSRFLVEDAVKKQAKMNQEARENALQSF